MLTSLGARLLIVSTSVFLVATGSLTAYWQHVASSLLRQRAIDGVEADLLSGARLLNNHARQESATIRFLAAHPSMRAYVAAVSESRSEDAELWRARCEANFRTQLETHPSQFQVRLIGLSHDGLELVRVQRHGDRIDVLANSELQPKASRPYFLQATGLSAGQVYFSDISLNVEHGRVEVPHRPTLRIATPVYTDDGAPFGIVVINADVSALLSRFEAAVARPNAAVYLARAQGDFALHEDSKQAFSGDLGLAFALHDEFGSAATGLTEFADARTGGLSTTFSAQGRLLSAARILVGDHGRTLLGIVAVNADALDENINARRDDGLLFSLLLILIGLVPTWLVARSITRPLKQLHKASDRVSEGLDPGSLPDFGEDEVGGLGRALHHMWQQLRTREAELSASRARLDAILEASTAAIFTVDERGSIEDVNSACELLLECERSELIGQSVETFLLHDAGHEGEGLMRWFTAQCDGGGREVLGQRKDGRRLRLWLSANTFMQAGRQLYVGLLIDTSHNRVLQDVMKRFGEIRRLMESTEELFIAANRALEITYMNPRAARALGVQVGPGPGPTLAVAAPQLAGLLQHSAKGLPVTQRVQLQVPKGWFRVTCSQDATGHYIQLVDITELMKQQVALEHSNKDLDDYARIASHDLQEPLRKIRAFAGRVETREGPTLAARSQDDLRRLQNAALCMTDLVRDLLELSRVSRRTADEEAIEIRPVVLEVVETIAGLNGGLEAQVSVAEDLGWAKVNRLHLRRLVQNLLNNALKFHRPGVPPVARIRRHPSQEAPGRVTLVVEDEGIGIDPAYADRVFQPFERLQGDRNSGSTGIGLTICRRIVERSGGTIWIDTAASPPGTRVAFTLPESSATCAPVVASPDQHTLS